MDELLSDERLEELLNDFALNVGPLSLPNERDERSEEGIWNDWLLRPVKLRDESMLDEERDCPDELPIEKLREDGALFPLLPL